LGEFQLHHRKACGTFAAIGHAEESTTTATNPASATDIAWRMLQRLAVWMILDSQNQVTYFVSTRYEPVIAGGGHPSSRIRNI
jgi:hypothetical protein